MSLLLTVITSTFLAGLAMPLGAIIACYEKIGSEWQLGDAKIISEDDNHKRIRFINSKGTKLEFFSYDWASEYKGLLGHCFPGADTYLGCGESNSVNWGEEVLKFFIENPKVDPS